MGEGEARAGVCLLMGRRLLGVQGSCELVIGTDEGDKMNYDGVEFGCLYWGSRLCRVLIS